MWDAANSNTHPRALPRHCRQMGIGVSICIIIWDKLWVSYHGTTMCFLTDPDKLECGGTA